jgi:hypothetical protein
MKTTESSISYSCFYDSVLHEIEMGKIDQGINLLVGLLDSVHLQGGSVDQARNELTQHMLHQMLLEDPIHRQAFRNPGDYSGLVDVISSPSNDVQTGSTGRRLFEATSQLGFIRALRQRRAMVDQKLENAWENGLRICIVDTKTHGDQRYLASRELSNVKFFDPALDDIAEFTSKSLQSFDLICAPDLADTSTAGKISDLLTLLRSTISANGNVFFPALRVDHVGSGWRRTFLNWEPNLHLEHHLQRAASDTGYSALTYADESGCIFWAALRPLEN